MGETDAPDAWRSPGLALAVRSRRPAEASDAGRAPDGRANGNRRTPADRSRWGACGRNGFGLLLRQTSGPRHSGANRDFSALGRYRREQAALAGILKSAGGYEGGREWFWFAAGLGVAPRSRGRAYAPVDFRRGTPRRRPLVTVMVREGPRLFPARRERPPAGWRPRWEEGRIRRPRRCRAVGAWGK